MSWTDTEQQEHRAAFIKECRQKAWGARCEADFLGKQTDKLTAEYIQFRAQFEGLGGTAEARKTHRQKREELAAGMKLIQEAIKKGQERMQTLLVQSDNNLALAKHAEGWGRQETKADQKTTIEVVEAPGDLCGNTRKLADGSPCPGCRACL